MDEAKDPLVLNGLYEIYAGGHSFVTRTAALAVRIFGLRGKLIGYLILLCMPSVCVGEV